MTEAAKPSHRPDTGGDTGNDKDAADNGDDNSPDGGPGSRPDSGASSLAATLEMLAETIAARRDETPENSYTASLLAKGVSHCARKFGEEAIELVIASLEEGPAAARAEAADVVYHLLVLLAARGISLNDIADELMRRRRQSGHDEKAARPSA